MTARTNTHIPLLPHPRSIVMRPGQSQLNIQPTIDLDPSRLIRPDEYQLEIDSAGVRIRARDDSAVRCALSTLDQIRQHAPNACPSLMIHDWADFETRGLMLDVSRDRIPTMDELRRLIPLLASLKFNHLQFYVEHTFAYPGHEAVWQGLDPITPDEVRELIALCRDVGIELAANQNCFGHLSGWLSHPAYAHLAETHGEYDFYGLTRNGPFSLIPSDAGALGLIEEWIRSLASCHASCRINIGCDETADVGAGRSKDRVEREGFASVYAKHVADVAAICRAHGLSPMFWADVASAHPEALDLLPDGMTALVWGYEPDSDFGDQLQLLNDRGCETWVCPGTSCWRTFAGRTSERHGNLLAASRAGTAAGCAGAMVTAWGDLGHRQQWPVSLRGIADAAQAFWSGELPTVTAVDACAFGEPGAGIAAWLDEMGDADQFLRASSGDLPRLLNASATFHELHPAHPSLPTRGSLSDWHALRSRFEDMGRSIPHTRSDQMQRELRHVHACSSFAADVGILRRGGDAETPDVRRIMDAHRELWLKRSRPGGLDSSLSHYFQLENAFGSFAT